MEPKRELTSVDIRALVRELGAYEGAKVDKAYLYDDDLVRLRMRHFERGRVELLIEVGERKRANVADPGNVPDAPGRPPDFAMMLRNRIGGADFAGVDQYEFDRILRFHFDRPDGRTTIVAELFGDGNVAVLDATGTVVECLEVVRLKSRTVAPGSQYEFPSSRVNPLRLSADGFVAHMRESDTDLVRTLATQLNLGGLYAEELCTRAGVEKTRSIDAATEADFDALYATIDELAAALEGGRFAPRIYREDGQPVDVTPFPLEEREGLAADSFDTFNDALDAYFTDLSREDDAPTRPDFESRIEKRERIIEQQEDAIERFREQADERRAAAETLYAHYDRVDAVLDAVRTAREDDVPWSEIDDRFEEGRDRGIPEAEVVVDVDGSSGTVTVELDGHTIELDPGTGVEKNADRLYGEAKDIEEKREGALAALEETREELAEIERERDAWAPDSGSATDATEEGAEVGDWLDQRSIPVTKPEHWFERFRWVHTSDGYLVLGGRNADQNEELVKKYLEPGDRFFHTQAAGGPATVLKATGPSEPSEEVEFPDATLEEAAQFAVTYSSVWKAGRYAGDVYMVTPDQVSKTPESGEYVEKGAFVIRGDRTYFHDTPVGCAVGIQCAPETRVVGGPPAAVEPRAETMIRVEPGEFAQADVAKRIYRAFRDRFTDTAFVRKIASPDEIGKFLPPGRSRIADE